MALQNITKKLLELLMDSFKFNSKVIALTATFKQNWIVFILRKHNRLYLKY